MEVLSSRLLLHPTDPARSRHFYRDVLGLAVYREFGGADEPGVVFFCGQGLLEVSGRSTERPGPALRIWLQVRDVDGEYRRLAAAGVATASPPRRWPWGLIEAAIRDPDGTHILLVEIPEDHPLRRDQR